MIQLKVRTEYSFGQTFAPVSRIIKRLQEIGCTAAAIVDEGSTWGHVKWFNECKAAGIQPMLGVELVVSDDDNITSMWFIAKNEFGLRELYRLSSKAHRQTIASRYGSSPRLYRDDVLGMSENIFKFAGTVTDKKFLEEAGAIVDIGPESRVLAIKKRSLGLPTVTVGDNAYAFPEDAETLEFIANNTKVSPQHILEDVGDEPLAHKIAEACADIQLPKAPMIRAEGDLLQLCRDGIKFRKLKWTDEYEQRMLYELELIKSKDFEAYFIVVADMVQYAKKHMLVGPSRGSAAGSLVCYLTRITEIDPIPPRLYFERFIDVSRSDLPDIDLDFPDNKRQMVFEYMANKYGFENTAHIGTISQFRSRSALIQVCKKLGIPPAATAGVKSAMIERSSADSRANNCLEDTLTETEPGKELVKAYPQVMKAIVLEGHSAHTGVHAAGLLVCNDRIDEYATVDHNGIAHVEKGAAEQLGLLKIDVLGLRTLGILEDCRVDIDWYSLPFDDQKTFDIFNQGKFCGIFQFEGNALRSISKEIKFETIIEVDAVTALARPGPFGGGVTEEYCKRKKGKPYEPIHPLVEGHMKDTFGLPVYQEQTLAIVREIGKFDWKETSTIRKAMSKRMGKEFFDTYWDKFKAGAMSQGISEKAARKTWETINAMGAWQMNKAHTYSYAVISYWTAYLKAHHPLEFAAANLRNAKDADSAIELLREMVKEGIEFTPFDLQLSVENWSTDGNRLVGGFMNLKGFGESKSKKFVEARNANSLTPKQLEQIDKAENAFSNIFPISTKYAAIYENPYAAGINSTLFKIEQLDGSQDGSCVFIGEVVYKNSRNANEEVNVKKRGGKMETGQLEFIDVRLRDDTGTIGARVGRWDYINIGKSLAETVPEGAHLLIRADFKQGIRFGFIKKWKRLDI